MKITSTTPWLISTPWPYLDTAGERPKQGEYVFVQVDTDEGITGWGEITVSSSSANRAACAFLKQAAPLIEGENPTEIERLWHKTFREFTYLGTRGGGSSAVSAIDIALWDIRGKQLGIPVYEMLGGKVRESIALYTHPNGGTAPESIAESCRAITETGHTALKTDPFPHRHGPGVTGYLDGQLAPEDEELGVRDECPRKRKPPRDAGRWRSRPRTLPLSSTGTFSWWP